MGEKHVTGILPSPDLAATRQLLLSVFTRDSLRRFCQKRPDLHFILNEFGPGQGLNEMIDRVIECCSTHQLWSRFFTLIRIEHPTQYADFATCLYPEGLPFEIVCPYRGLEPFAAEDSQFYFGREGEVARLVSKIGDSSFVALIGPSGCGKSSLIRAGLLPALRNGILPGSEAWKVCVFQPGASPFLALSPFLIEMLKSAVSEASHDSEAAELADQLQSGLVSMADIGVQLRYKCPDVTHLLLVVDQFEELYTKCQEDIIQAFIHALKAAATAPNIMVIVAVRAEFCGHLSDDYEIGELADAGCFYMLPMDKEQLQASIKQPALRAGRSFEEGLAERIVEEIIGQPGDLPLLQLALTELWEYQTPHGLLTHAGYEAMGRVKSSVARYAETVYEDQVRKGQGPVVRHIFLRLADYRLALNRHQVLLHDLVTSRMPLQAVEPVVQELVNARLLVTGPAGTKTFAVTGSHEFLIWGWERTRRWLEEETEFGLWWRRIAISRHLWEETSRDKGNLLRGVSLADAEHWLSKRGDDLSADELKLIQESLVLRDQEEADRKETKPGGTRPTRRWHAARRRGFPAVALGLCVLLIAVSVGLALAFRSSVLGEHNVGGTGPEPTSRATARAPAATQGYSIAQGGEADHSLSAAVSAQATAEASALACATAQIQNNASGLAFAAQSQMGENQELALLLAIEAAQTDYTRQTDSVLRTWFLHHGRTLQLLFGHRQAVVDVAWDVDGHRIATASFDGTVRIWDARTGAELRILGGHRGSVSHVVWDGTGQRIATAGADGTLRVWDAGSGTELAVLTGGRAALTSIEWDSEGDRLVSTSEDGKVRVWDTEKGVEQAILDARSTIWDAAWDRDGRRIATAGFDHVARIWDAESGAELAVLDGHKHQVKYVGWDPECRRVLTVSLDRTARVWDAETGNQLAVLSGHTDEVLDAAWSPDGSRIVTGSLDDTARVWDAETGNQLAVLAGHKLAVRSVAWDKNGLRIVTASEDGTARVWNAKTGEDLAVLTGHTDRVWDAAWDCDGRRVVTASLDGTARIWDPSDQGDEAVLSGHRAWIFSAAWDGEGRRILSASEDGTSRVWDANSGEELLVLAGHTEQVLHAAWSPDDLRIVTASWDGTARIWDAESGAELAILGAHGVVVRYAAWDREGKRIVTVSDDHTARIWDSESGSELVVLAGHTSGVRHAAWDSEGQRVATASWDWTARVWDAESGKQLTVLARHEKEVIDVEWDHAGQRIATAAWDHTAKVWDTQTWKELFTLSGHGSEVKHVAWSPDDRRIITVNLHGAARVWDAENGTELAVLVGDESDVLHAAWSPDGHSIVTGEGDGFARVWDAETGAELMVLPGHSWPVRYVAWDPQGDRIVTAGDDHTLRIHYVSAEGLLRAACQRAVRNMSLVEWQEYMGDEPYRETCLGKPVPERDYH